jgi:hypothetical protein
MQLTVDRARSTLGPLCEGGIQTRMSLAKKGIRSRGEEQKKEEGLKFKDYEKVRTDGHTTYVFLF